MKLTACFVLIFSFYYSGNSQVVVKWFDKESIACTVLLEKEQSGRFISHGTGFLILSYKTKNTIVITCEHLLRNSSIYLNLEVNEKFRNKFRSLSVNHQRELLNQITAGGAITWNPNENFLRIRVPLLKDSTFYTHPNQLDIGAFKVFIPGTVSINDSSYLLTDAKRLGRSRIMQREQIELGEDTYFIGFPFGIGSPVSLPSQSTYTTSAPQHLLRRGTIAWISDDYDEFLLDALSFGGNSGSPLFQISYEPGKPPYYLIGIVIGHISANISNAGLARCLSVNEINKVIELADK